MPVKFVGVIPNLSNSVWDRAGFKRFVVGKTVEEVETLIAEGHVFSPSVKGIAETWVRQQKDVQAAERARAGLELERRSVEAAERAAAAAEQSAKAAKDSARTSVIALVVAAAAALVAAWPLIKDVGRPPELLKTKGP